MLLLHSRKRKSALLLEIVFTSLVLQSVTRALITLHKTHVYMFDRNDYDQRIYFAADIGTML